MTRHFLDITGDTCPLTFVKTKLLLEKMAAGDIAEIRLRGSEPVENVPRSVRDHGHEIVSLTPEKGRSGNEAVHILILKK